MTGHALKAGGAGELVRAAAMDVYYLPGNGPGRCNLLRIRQHDGLFQRELRRRGKSIQTSARSSHWLGTFNRSSRGLLRAAQLDHRGIEADLEPWRNKHTADIRLRTLVTWVNVA
ncbi:hypothetical protein [Streptomyces hiroshimensis]|uniref:Transposase n=1 Tax=Streptomyces hiroshimensis TaxID=66424 RepID=A0ABQ2Z2Y2_9ACTN|nr:hypothetical protein [Streptomyces hiroshimensis]GGY02706.1 hypothetical protein GCM10010324_57110 [Streptomyces hiroshimensis]